MERSNCREKPRRATRAGLAALLALVAFSCSAISASASAFDDIPEAFAGALGVTEFTAKMIFAVAIIVTVSMVLAIARIPLEGYIIVLLAVIGLLTAIQWLDPWMLILSAVITAVLFAGMVKGGYSPGG